ncbi:MAG: NusG domain II-containing protein [Fibrobacterota bacterium]
MNSLTGVSGRTIPKVGDFIVLGLILFASLASVHRLPTPGRSAVLDIYIDGTRVRTLAAGADTLARDTLPVRNGRLVFEYGRGSARVSSANCPNKNCEHSGAVSRNGQSLICVPNHVMAVLRSSGASLDGLAR